jgi:HlyD family secretion protein
MVTNAEAAWIDARETLLITKSLAQSSVEAAQLKYDFAKLDWEKYEGDGGQYATDLAKAKGDIALNQQEVEKNKDYYDWSGKLAQERYLSDTQLKADELTLKKSELNLQVAQNNLDLLEKYTRQRQRVQLQSDVNQAQAALERAQAKARANIAQAEAHLAARAQEYRHQQEMLAKHEEEIRQSKLYAPVDGLVIYATSVRGGFRDDRRPLADGVDVWERQELIYLQRSTSVVAEVDLHEANLQKVRPGLPAVVTVDALPGQKFMGTISRMAPLADAQSMWMNPDLKVYKTEIALEVNDPQLRSGMTCKAEIIVERHAEAVYVPLQAVVRVAGQPTVYVFDENAGTDPRRVEIGLDDNTLVRITGGLEAGELVLLAPQKAAAGAPGTRWTGMRGADVNEMTQQIGEKLKVANGPGPVAQRPTSGGPGQKGTQ